MRRVLPAIVLFFLAPLISEFLLGDLPLTLLPALIVLAPMYGGGALLIREITRRTGRGWPTIILLGLLYAVFEEAFTTQTLFNPDYLHLHAHLLQPAYVAALGMGAWWTFYVLTLHTVWSISTSIALTEGLFPDRGADPWLSRTGLRTTFLLLMVGAFVMTKLTIKGDPFVASKMQFAGSGIVCVLIGIAAFRVPSRWKRDEAGKVPSPWLAGIFGLAVSTAFMLVPPGWSWGAVGAYLGLYAVALAVILAWSRPANWDGRHTLALAAGTALTYAWHGFPQRCVVPVSQTVDLVGNIVFSLGAVFVIWMAARRTGAALRRRTA